jgi:PTS system ascorbate-specific IIC component
MEDLVMAFLEFLLSVVQTPALILGLVALVGLALQRKTGTQIFSGTIKTALGMLILSGGVGVLIGAILPFVFLFQEVFNLDGFATGSEIISASMMDAVPAIASASAIIMAVGFLVNIILARFTPLKYIFLTGHMMWMASVLVAYVLFVADFSNTMIIVVGSIIQGALLTILPAISQPAVRKITGNNDIALAHLTTLGTVPSAYIGKLVGNPAKSTEDLKLPKGLSFFKDTAVAVSVVMLIFYLILVIVAGPERVAAHAGDTNFIIFGILQALGFAAGVLILLQGVRMFLGELVPAFKGISDKLVPNAIPALDVPAIFPYAPNALMIGFITSVGGMLVAMAASGAAFGVVPLVSIIGAFFTGGVAGIMGNALGGRRGAVVAGFSYGFILIFLSGFTFNLFDGFRAIGVEGAAGHDCVDAMVTMVAFQNPWIGMVILAVAFVVLSFFEVRYQKNKREEK